MRPKSIIYFEILCFVLVGLMLAYRILTFSAVAKSLQGAAQTSGLPGDAAGMAIAAAAVSSTIYLLLWFFIARRASMIAKWIFVALTIANFVNLAALATRWEAVPRWHATIAVLIAVVGLGALALLFRPDAREWFSGRGPIDPKIFS